jgi:uncharacterized protein YbjT (DUF2867 family)
MKKITVIGATGMIGIPVTKELINAGFDVTALVRNIEKAKQIFPNGVNFVKGDIEDKNSIANSLKNAECVYINISTRPTDKENKFNPEMHGIDNILWAIKQSQIKQVAYLSSFLARNYKGNWWVMKAKQECITKVKNCNIPYTIFYPSNFMENFLNGMKRGNKISTIGRSENKAWWISGEDFGKQVANSFNTEKSLNKEYSVQGIESLTTHEAARKFVENYAKEKLSVSSMPLGMLKFIGLFAPQMKNIANLMEVMINNVETFEAQQTWNELGKPTKTIKDFLI